MSKASKSSLIRKIFNGFLILLATVLVAAAVYINSLLPIITGYAAKNLCSGVFVSGRSAEDLESVDLNFSFIKLTNNNVDYEKKTVTSRFLWARSKAIYREGFGATLLRDVDEDSLREIIFPQGLVAGYMQDTIAWPLGDIMPDTATATGIDIKALNSITDKLVSDNAYGGNAFAFLVVHRGVAVAEAYKPRFNKDTRFLGWSMGKSITNALIGIMVKDGRLDISKPAAIPGWSDDERKTITLNDLMQMQSGLKWNENYGNRSDVTVMLHCESDFAGFAYNQPLEYPVTTHWYYSSGTTNIVNYLLRTQFEDDESYYAFPHKELFYKIGITDAVFETDPSGTVVGSSYIYARARDYARFALLYTQDGVFNDERILPEGWVDYSVAPTSASKGEYGSFFWLNGAGEIPSGPDDLFICIGHDGQRIIIMPSQDMIVVVLGYSPNDSMDFDSLIADILNTLPEDQG